MYQSERNPKLIIPSTPQTCSMEIVPRRFKVHNVSESELYTLAHCGNSVNLAFFGICFGAGISFGIVLFSGGISDIQKATYKMLLCAAAVLAGYLGIQSIRSYRQSRRTLKNLMAAK